MTDTKCPVCEISVPEDADYCPQCEWTFRYFLNLTETEARQYQQTLKAAQAQWMARQAPEIATGSSALDIPPALQRDVFETAAELKSRIEDNGPYAAGTVHLLLDKYDAERQILPIRLIWQDWLQHPQTDNYYLNVDRQTARNLLDAGETYTAFANLQVDGESISINGLSLGWQGESLSVRQIEDEHSWLWARRINTPKAYQQYLLGDTLRNYQKLAWIYLQKSLKKHQQQNWFFYGFALFFAVTGALTGTIIGISSLETLIGGLFGSLFGGLLTAGSFFFIIVLFKTKRFIGSNTLYAIDSVNGQRLHVQHIVINSRQTPKIHLKGWAVDAPAKQPASGMFLIVDDEVLSLPAVYGYERADIVRTLHHEAYRACGFSVTLDVSHLLRGKHQLILKILSADGKGYFLPEKAFVLMLE